MNAKTINRSNRQLFLHGGRLDVLLCGHAEMNRQFEKLNEERRAKFFPDPVKECPCGCGLEGDVCENRLCEVAAQNAEIPF